MAGLDRASCSLRRMLGAELRSRRLQLGISQENLAWEVDVAQGSISNYEVGRTDVPITVLFSICRALKTTPASLLAGFGEAQEPSLRT